MAGDQHSAQRFQHRYLDPAALDPAIEDVIDRVFSGEQPLGAEAEPVAAR